MGRLGAEVEAVGPEHGEEGMGEGVKTRDPGAIFELRRLQKGREHTSGAVMAETFFDYFASLTDESVDNPECNRSHKGKNAFS